MLVLSSWIFLVVARVFMISLARVLERLKNCTMFVIKLWHTMGKVVFVAAATTSPIFFHVLLPPFDF